MQVKISLWFVGLACLAVAFATPLPAGSDSDSGGKPISQIYTQRVSSLRGATIDPYLTIGDCTDKYHDAESHGPILDAWNKQQADKLKENTQVKSDDSGLALSDDAEGVSRGNIDSIQSMLELIKEQKIQLKKEAHDRKTRQRKGEREEFDGGSELSAESESPPENLAGPRLIDYPDSEEGESKLKISNQQIQIGEDSSTVFYTCFSGDCSKKAWPSDLDEALTLEYGPNEINLKPTKVRSRLASEEIHLGLDSLDSADSLKKDLSVSRRVRALQREIGRRKSVSSIEDNTGGTKWRDKLNKIKDPEVEVQKDLVPSGESGIVVHQVQDPVVEEENESLDVSDKNDLSGENFEENDLLSQESNTKLPLTGNKPHQNGYDESKDVIQIRLDEEARIRSETQNAVTVAENEARAVPWYKKAAPRVILFVWILAMAYGITYVVRESNEAAALKAQNKAFLIQNQILASVANPEVFQADRCQKMHAIALKSEGVGQELLSVAGWKDTMTSFELSHRQAYDSATLNQMDRISLASIKNWGTPAILPTIPYNPRDRQRSDYDRINVKYEEDMSLWHQTEFFRPLRLQYQFEEYFERSVHDGALDFLRNTTDLPFHVNSKRFSAAYIGYYLRMLIPSECFPHINEDKGTFHLFNTSRTYQTIRKTQLQLTLNQYFHARSAIPPTPPIAAVREAPYHYD